MTAEERTKALLGIEPDDLPCSSGSAMAKAQAVAAAIRSAERAAREKALEEAAGVASIACASPKAVAAIRSLIPSQGEE